MGSGRRSTSTPEDAVRRLDLEPRQSSQPIRKRINSDLHLSLGINCNKPKGIRVRAVVEQVGFIHGRNRAAQIGERPGKALEQLVVRHVMSSAGHSLHDARSRQMGITEPDENETYPVSGSAGLLEKVEL